MYGMFVFNVRFLYRERCIERIGYKGLFWWFLKIFIIDDMSFKRVDIVREVWLGSFKVLCFFIVCFD